MAKKFNNEGYADPTAFEALNRIEQEERESRYRPIVYICSPFSGKEHENKINARKYCRFALEKHTIPFAPHLLFPQFMDDTLGEERQTAMFMNYVMLTKCVELWVFGGNISEGMAQEIMWAKRRHMPIRYFTEKMEEVL